MISDDVIDKPGGRLVIHILVAIDILLLEGPVRELLVVCPKGDFGGDVNEFEVARLGPPRLAIVRVGSQLNLEEGIVVAGMVSLGPGGEFLIGWEHGRGNIVGEQVGVGVDVEELNNILVPHNAAATGLRKGFSGDDTPVVVGVVMSITGNLLP